MDTPCCKDEKLLREMYRGEERRDATSKYLGYIYQDLVAIEYLLDENVEYLCMECVEDIFFVRNTGKGREYNVVQVKYYPNSAIKKEDVLRDLYYQYIRLYGFDCKNIKIYLRYHTAQKIEFEKKDYNKLENSIEKKPYQNISGALSGDIEKAGRKIAAENDVIYKYSGEQILEAFKNAMEEGNNHSPLNEFEFCKQLAKKIYVYIKSEKEDYNIEQQEEILLGLAICRIHWFYQQYANERDPIKKCIYQQDFWEHIRRSFDSSIETTSAYIIKILQDIEIEVFSYLDDLDDSNEIDDLRRQYKRIFENIEKWLLKITNNEDGIKSLIRTVFQEKEFCEKTLFLQVVKEKTNIKKFLMRLAKIMFDIYFAQKTEGNDDVALLDPETHCIDHSNCIMFHFKHDCGTSMILSRIDSDMMESTLIDMYPRLTEYKPQKWYLPGSCVFRGIKSYDLNVCSIIDSNDMTERDLDIAYIHDGYFVVECMSCIKVDRRDWNKKDLNVSSKFLKLECEEDNA